MKEKDSELRVVANCRNINWKYSSSCKKNIRTTLNVFIQYLKTTFPTFTTNSIKLEETCTRFLDRKTKLDIFLQIYSSSSTRILGLEKNYLWLQFIFHEVVKFSNIFACLTKLVCTTEKTLEIETIYTKMPNIESKLASNKKWTKKFRMIIDTKYSKFFLKTLNQFSLGRVNYVVRKLRR